VQASFSRKIGWIIEAAFYDAYVALMRVLPIDMASAVGGWLFRTLGPLTSTQKTVRKNIDLAFPNMCSAQKKALILDHWERTGRTTAEFPIMDRIKNEPERIKVVGLEHLRPYIVAKKPFVAISMHQSNWELAPIIIIQAGIPFLVTYRAANNPYVDKRIKDARFRYGVRLFGPKGNEGAKELMAALQRGDSVGLMNDQKFNRGVKTPFFGSVVETAPGPTRLAQRFNTELIPFSVKRLRGARFEVTIHPPISVVKSESKAKSIESTVKQITQWVESVIKDNPADWFWVHKRWPNDTYR
jgi:KDO2-lipid IV(A) lauroyltransferase